MHKIPYPILLLPSYEPQNPEVQAIVIKHQIHKASGNSPLASAIEAYFTDCLGYVREKTCHDSIIHLYPESVQRAPSIFREYAKLSVHDIFRVIIAEILDKIQFEQAKRLLVNMVRQRDKIQKAIYQPNSAYFEMFMPVTESFQSGMGKIFDQPVSSGVYPKPICSKRISLMDILHQVNLSILHQSIHYKPECIPAFMSFYIDVNNIWITNLTTAYNTCIQRNLT